MKLILSSKLLKNSELLNKNNATFIENLRKILVKNNEVEHDSEKFNENMLNFNRHLTQTVNDINELLNDSYMRYSDFKESIQLESNEQENLNDTCRTQIDASESEIIEEDKVNSDILQSNS